MVKLWAPILREGASAMSRRLGTAAAGMLIAQGIPEDLVTRLLVALGVVGGICFDIALAIYHDREKR